MSPPSMKPAPPRAAAPEAAIYLLNGFPPNSGDALAAINVQPVIGDLNELAEWDMFCRRTGWKGGAAVHIDTGMNRLGLGLVDVQGLIPRLGSGDHGFTLVMSHLACAEQLHNPIERPAIFQFPRGVLAVLRRACIPANSSGIYLGAAYQFDLMRPGAALYGVNPTPEADNPMAPVVDLKVRILQTRSVERGDSVGYGATWVARRPTRLAIIAAGYADGYFRAAGSSDGTRGAEVIIAGQRCPDRRPHLHGSARGGHHRPAPQRRPPRPSGNADRRRHHRRRTRASLRHHRL